MGVREEKALNIASNVAILKASKQMQSSHEEVFAQLKVALKLFPGVTADQRCFEFNFV